MPVTHGHQPRASRLLDRYELVLALLLVVYILVGSSGLDRGVIIAQGVLVAAVTLFTLRASGGVRRETLHLVALGALALALLVVIESATTTEPLAGYAALTALLIPLPYFVLRRIFEQASERVWEQTIIAAICTYLLIGLIFCYAMLLLNAIETKPLLDPPSAAPGEFLYLSFTALTTVGFGDVTAATKLGRVVVTLEAVIGQVFLVTLVARLVAAFQPTRRQHHAEGPDDRSGRRDSGK